MTLLECQDLLIGYDHPIMDTIQLSIEEGSYTVIAGENGSGKSTLLKTILGIIRPISGTVNYLPQGRQNIGYVPQQADLLPDFPATVREVVQSGALNYMKYNLLMNRSIKNELKDVLERMELTHIANHSVHRLSGGQKQRMLIARALMASRTFLVLDEPTNGIDPMGRSRIYRLLDTLHKDGVTILMISHDIDTAYSYATQIIELSDGGLIVKEGLKR